MHPCLLKAPEIQGETQKDHYFT